MKKLIIPKEVLYIIALLLLSFGVALSVIANLGISTCSAPGLAISIKMQQVLNKDATNPFIYTVLTSLTFGEWCVQVAMLLVFCLVIRRFSQYTFLALSLLHFMAYFYLLGNKFHALNQEVNIHII